MTQALLADRFKLAAHYETRQMPVFDLVLGESGKDRISTPATSERSAVLGGRGNLDRPVFDRTGLAGDFDFWF